MSKRLIHPRFTVNKCRLDGKTEIELRAHTPKAGNVVDIEMTMSEWQLTRLAKEIRDALRELAAERARQSARSLAIYNDQAR